MKATLEANELRIGNIFHWVDHWTHIDINKLWSWDATYKSAATGEPLTEEWLVKFGFKYSNQHGGWYIPLVDSKKLVIDLDTNKAYLSNVYLNKLRVLEYVHQLQNLYFALTDSELSV